MSLWKEVKNCFAIRLTAFIAGLLLLIFSMSALTVYMEHRKIAAFATDPRTEADFKYIDSLFITPSGRRTVKLELIRQIKMQDKRNDFK
jgi:hypothetical protein